MAHVESPVNLLPQITLSSNNSYIHGQIDPRMKYIFALIFLCFASSAHSQLLSGELLDEKRKMTSKQDFVILSDFYEGHVTYELAVDRTGKVTSERFIPEQSTVKSTPANVQAKNYLKDFTFEPGDHYPRHHHVIVKVKFAKPAPAKQQPKPAK